MARPRPDGDPVEGLFERIAEGDPVTRRDALRRFAAVMAVGGGASAFLSACGGIAGTAGKGRISPVNVQHEGQQVGSVRFSNWPLYIDENTVKDFDKATGGRMTYIEDYNDNEEFFAKVRQQLEAGTSIGRDLVAPTDWMAARWIDLGYAEPIDKANVPNRENLEDSLKHPPYDKNRDYTLPWQSGITGVGYNPKKTGRKLTSVNDLFDPKFKGRVTMFTEWRDSAGLVLLGMGKDPTTASADDYKAAIEKIDEENRKGQIRRFTGNDYTKDLASGNLWACVAWSGDLVQLQADNPNLEFLVPEEGAMSWSDNMLMPAHAKNYYGAERWMNFVYQPAIAAQIAGYVNYFCPVKGAKEILAKTDAEAAANPLIFPTEDMLKQLHPYPSLGAAAEERLTAQMQAVTGA